MTGIKFKMARDNNIVYIYAVFPDLSRRLIALYEVPNDMDWRADVDFYDCIIETYKKRYSKII